MSHLLIYPLTADVLLPQLNQLFGTVPEYLRDPAVSLDVFKRYLNNTFVRY